MSGYLLSCSPAIAGLKKNDCISNPFLRQAVISRAPSTTKRDCSRLNFDFSRSVTISLILLFWADIISSICILLLRYLLLDFNFRPHLREEEDILYCCLIGHKHCESVYSDSHSRCRRHPIFEGPYKVHIYKHCLIVAFILKAELIFKAVELINRVVQFTIGICKLLSAYEQFETLCKIGVFPMSLCEWRH